MEIIETQYRAGNISFVDNKDKTVEETKESTSPGIREQPRHSRKRSVLVKGFRNQHFRHSKELNLTVRKQITEHFYLKRRRFIKKSFLL